MWVHTVGARNNNIIGWQTSIIVNIIRLSLKISYQHQNHRLKNDVAFPHQIYWIGIVRSCSQNLTAGLNERVKGVMKPKNFAIVSPGLKRCPRMSCYILVEFRIWKLCPPNSRRVLRSIDYNRGITNKNTVKISSDQVSNWVIDVICKSIILAIYLFTIMYSRPIFLAVF